MVLQVLAEKKLLKGNTIGVDATTLEANAALRSIVRRDTGEKYEEFLTRLAKQSGIETPTREQLAKLDRKRPKKGSNDDWTQSARSRRADHQDEGWTDASGAQSRARRGYGDRSDCGRHAARADQGDTKTIQETVAEAGERITSWWQIPTTTKWQVQVSAEGPRELVTDKGYHSRAVVTQMAEWGVRTYCSEPDRGRQRWPDQRAQQRAVYANRRRIRGERGRRLLRQRGEKLERWNQHLYDRGGMRRVHLRGRENILKRLMVHSGATNLGLLMRKLFGKGTPRASQGLRHVVFSFPGVSPRFFCATASLVSRLRLWLVYRRPFQMFPAAA